MLCMEMKIIRKRKPEDLYAFSQFIANFSCHLLVLDLCMSYSFTTIVIAALMDVTGEGFTIDTDQASWLGKYFYNLKPVLQVK